MTMANTTNSTSISDKEASSETLDVKYVIVYSVLYPIICSVGILGNILTLSITCKMRKSTSSTYLITGLSVADIMALIARFLYVLYRTCQLYFSTQTVAFSTYVPSLAFLMLTLMMKRLSKVILIPVSLERLIAIWFPLRYRGICTTRTTKVATFAIALVVAGLNIPVIVDVVVSNEKVVNDGGEVFAGKLATIKELTRYNAKRTEAMTDFYRVNRFLFDLFPIIFVLCTDISIVIGIRSNIRRLEKSCSNSVLSTTRKIQTKQLTRMLLGVCFAFVLLCLPGDVISIAVNFFGITGISTNVYIVTDMLSTINHAVNFVFYCAFNPSYRQMYWKFITCKKGQIARVSSEVLSRSSRSIVSSERMNINNSNASISTMV